MPSWTQPDPSSRFTGARQRDDPLLPSKRAWRLVIAATAGAVAGRRVAVAGRAMAGAEDKPAFTLIATVAKAEHLASAIVW